MKKVPSFARMKASEGKYITVYRRFRRYVRDNYAFGFAFQSTCRDFILFAPNLPT